jgi:hypothetical protein
MPRIPPVIPYVTVRSRLQVDRYTWPFVSNKLGILEDFGNDSLLPSNLCKWKDLHIRM